ncbi:integrase catalytic domain-containing protein [Trichonephila inaurata madagascariensis]|uniref:Integrase catalytic domain-containing protein n=1 Tax=Trichonephila inaurata madagascariensis TaxID=2747483 RepID=A0A8X6WZK2_9ARAC|nr:integrase catalytic domain-containing protein [Trichonephila inaurata madagascariensis]GFY55380.1 integrase catalytic domain-containing protein [Trichonephila inaurata madagascariensis]
MKNNRPITYVSEDIDDLFPLTPAMFLHEIRETGVPDLDQLDSSSINRRLVQLKQNYKSVKKHDPIGVGEIVLVSSDDIKHLEWLLARVLEAYKSDDRHNRLVKLRTKSGEILRPVARLLPLEIRNYSTSTNNFPFSDSPETVCFLGSDAAVPITLLVPVDAAIVRILDENGSPVHAVGVINGQDETILDASSTITPNGLKPAFLLNIPYDPVPAFPLTITDHPEPEDGYLSDPSPDKITIKTMFGRVVKPVNRLKI